METTVCLESFVLSGILCLILIIMCLLLAHSLGKATKMIKKQMEIMQQQREVIHEQDENIRLQMEYLMELEDLKAKDVTQKATRIDIPVALDLWSEHTRYE